MKKNSSILRIVALLTFVLLISNAEATIVNINSRSNNSVNPVELLLNQGTYTVVPIGSGDGGSFDAWNAWGSTTCGNSSGCQRTSPTSVVGWLNAYSVISSDISSVAVGNSSLSPINSNPPGLDSYFLVSPSETKYVVNDGFVYPNSLIALAFSQQSVFTLDTASVVGFAIPDSPLFDNSGGISLNINAVPIPAGIWLFISGMVSFLGFTKIKK